MHRQPEKNVDIRCGPSLHAGWSTVRSPRLAERTICVSHGLVLEPKTVLHTEEINDGRAREPDRKLTVTHQKEIEMNLSEAMSMLNDRQRVRWAEHQGVPGHTGRAVREPRQNPPRLGAHHERACARGLRRVRALSADVGGKGAHRLRRHGHGLHRGRRHDVCDKVSSSTTLPFTSTA